MGWRVLLTAMVLAAVSKAQNQLPLTWNANPEAEVSGYVVYLGTTSGIYPTIIDVGEVTSHTFSGLTGGTIYYCRIQAYNSSGLASEISPEVALTLESAAVLFGGWASAGGLNGPSALPGATPFHDGVPNLLKFAFNLNPAGPDVRTLAKGSGTAGLPLFVLDRSGAQNRFTVEYLRRRNSGLTYVPKTSTDFGVFSPMTGTTTVTGINADWERVVVQMPLTGVGGPRLFGRVEVILP